MNEKIYKTMGITGAANISMGIIIMVIGLITGILSIICGTVLLKSKNKIMF